MFIVLETFKNVAYHFIVRPYFVICGSTCFTVDPVDPEQEGKARRNSIDEKETNLTDVFNTSSIINSGFVRCFNYAGARLLVLFSFPSK